MVPGRCLCGSAVLAAMATLAPSRAARRAMARPMPRLAPVTNRVFPAKLIFESSQVGSRGLDRKRPKPLGGVRVEGMRHDAESPFRRIERRRLGAVFQV